MTECQNSVLKGLREVATALFALALIVPITLSFLFSIVDDFRISINQRKAQAEVFDVYDEWEERNDGRSVVQMFYFKYGFTVEGKRYYGNGETQREPPPDVITIGYDANNPNANRVKTGSFTAMQLPPSSSCC